ncbi:MAG: hypothetical protein MZU84_04100 [Sphingobacterium sp.]|nr:hypothetical protein [Sphingobacterium sp.]
MATRHAGEWPVRPARGGVAQVWRNSNTRSGSSTRPTGIFGPGGERAAGPVRHAGRRPGEPDPELPGDRPTSSSFGADRPGVSCCGRG